MTRFLVSVLSAYPELWSEAIRTEGLAGSESFLDLKSIAACQAIAPRGVRGINRRTKSYQ